MKSLDHNLLAQFVCRHFQLGEWKAIEGGVGGSFNVNFKIRTDHSSYVVHVLNKNNTAEHLRFVQRTLLELSEHAVPVIQPMVASNGEPFAYYLGELVQVTPYCHAAAFQCKQNQVFHSGVMLRKFHEALAKVQPGPAPGWSFFRPNEFYDDALGRLKSLFVIPETQLSEIERLSETIWRRWNDTEKELPETILHGDWHFWNQLYEGRAVKYILDFDFLQYGKRIMDTAYTMWVVYMLLQDHAAAFDHAFLKGYGPLTEEEIRVLPSAISIIALFFLCQAAHASNPLEKWSKQFSKQAPLMQWLHAEGGERIIRTAKNIGREIK